jgi:hypothetical protein
LKLGQFLDGFRRDVAGRFLDLRKLQLIQFHERALISEFGGIDLVEANFATPADERQLQLLDFGDCGFFGLFDCFVNDLHLKLANFHWGDPSSLLGVCFSKVCC